MRARRGLGASFADYSGDPAFVSAWNTVGGQLSSEGSGPSSLAYQTSQQAFADTYTQLFEQLGQDPSTALSAASQYLLGAHTVAGAAASIGGLISAAASGVAPSQAVQLFTGTMIGVAAAAGVVSAGVGAAIVAGVGVLASLLFGGGSPGFSIPGCPASFSQAPEYSVGCVGVFGLNSVPIQLPGGQSITTAAVQSPSSSLWKKFPTPQNDPDWFLATNSINWQGGQWQSASIPGTSPVIVPGQNRLIDIAFPQYHLLECEEAANAGQAGPVASFLKAFSAAWKSNQEYALNGLVAQPDWQVFLHVVRQWNASHAPLGQTAQAALAATASSAPLPASGFDFTPNGMNLSVAFDCSDFAVPYESMLVGEVNQVDPGSAPGGKVTINTGPALEAPPIVFNPGGIETSLQHPNLVSTPASTTATKVAVGTGALLGAGALGIGVLALAKGWAYGKAADVVWQHTGGRLWDEVKRRVHR